MERCNPRQFHQNQVLSRAKARLFLTVWSDSRYDMSAVKKILKKYPCWQCKITGWSNSISLQKRAGGNMSGNPSCGWLPLINIQNVKPIPFLSTKKDIGIVYNFRLSSAPPPLLHQYQEKYNRGWAQSWAWPIFLWLGYHKPSLLVFTFLFPQLSQAFFAYRLQCPLLSTRLKTSDYNKEHHHCHHKN